MVLASVTFLILINCIAIIGLAGNIRFIILNWKEAHIHKRLLLMMAVLHTPMCLIQFPDAIRVFMGIRLTRLECLRFTGIISSSFSLAQSLLHSLIALELLILVGRPLLYARLKTRWFAAPVASSFAVSGYFAYASWMATDNQSVLMCTPPTALSPDIIRIRYTFMFADCIAVLLLYSIFFALLWQKRRKALSQNHEPLFNRIILSSIIIALVYLLSWFSTVLLSKFAQPLSNFLHLPQSTVLMFGAIPASITFGQTHYVYFFLSAENRRAFRLHGPIALFWTCPEVVTEENAAGPSYGSTSSKIPNDK